MGLARFVSVRSELTRDVFAKQFIAHLENRRDLRRLALLMIGWSLPIAMFTPTAAP